VVNNGERAAVFTTHPVGQYAVAFTPDSDHVGDTLRSRYGDSDERAARRGAAKEADTMGYPVVHFEITGRDAKQLHSYYSELFDWQINADNPMDYGIVAREDNLGEDGIGIGGGIARGPEGYDGHVTFYVQVPDVEASLAKAESLGGTRMMGPEEVMEGLVIGLFSDPEGHVIGVMTAGG
jgi:predicted enzyme related to lactoylglutathione lyase